MRKKQQHKEKTGCRSTNRNTAKIDRTIQMTNHRGIHQSQQGNGDIGEDHR
jgi:hypothetical protein